MTHTDIDNGDEQGVTATQLGSSAIRASVERAGVEPEQVEEVYMGCVLQVLLHTQFIVESFCHFRTSCPYF